MGRRARLIPAVRRDMGETAANMVVGTLINWSVLVLVFHAPAAATGVTLTMIAVSSARQFVLRRLFRAWERRNG